MTSSWALASKGFSNILKFPLQMLLSAVIHFSRLSKEKKLAEVMALEFFLLDFVFTRILTTADSIVL